MVEKQLDKQTEALGAGRDANSSDSKTEVSAVPVDTTQVNTADAIKCGGGSFR